MPDPIDLDARLEELFAGPPDGFVAAREAIVKELKQAGRRDDAAMVHALRRPTVAVWGVNQMARARPDHLAALVSAGAEIDDLQHRGAKARDELRAASRRRRALLDELTDLAASLTERPDTVRSSIAATLDAASLDDTLQDDLLRGRLTTELAPAVRFFGDLGDLGDVDDVSDAGDPKPPPRKARAVKRAAPAPPVRDDLAARRAATALAEARARAEVADDEMRDAEGDTRTAHERLETAHRQVAELETALADKRAEVTDAKRQVTEAGRAETRARTAQRRAQAALRVAERHAQEADA
jgi:hypothetical protein